jgi:hypothetical protein
MAMRKLFVMLVSIAAVLGSGSAALAKEPIDPIAGHLVITGPGLDRPIELQGEVYWSPEYGIGGTAEPGSTLTTTLNQLGLLGAGPEYGWYVLTPDARTLGPAYRIKEFLDANGTGSTTATPTVATLYPYAPERPLVQVSVELPRSTARTGLWWSAPPELFSWLVSQGLSATPVAGPAQLPDRPVIPEAPSVLPVILSAMLALATLGAMGVVAWRRLAGRVRS